jgi:DNA-binding LytR/AlgR family response regulator
MKIVIIEDEEFAARRLQGMIHTFDPSIQILAKLESVEDSVEWFLNNPEPDLIFLDIHLEDGLGFTIFEKVQVKSPIIFTTAFDEYAIKAFKLKSIDYLLKPITQEDLNKAILKYKDWNGSKRSVVDVEALYEILTSKTSQYKTRFSITVGQKIKTITLEDVAYFYSEESITFLVTKDKSEYPLDYSLDKLAGELDPKEFFRINRQFLVSLHSIANVHIYPKSHLRIDLIPGSQKEIFVSIDKVTAFKEWLGS